MPPPTLRLSATIMPCEDPHPMALDGGGDGDGDGEGPRPRATLGEEEGIEQPTAAMDTHVASTPSGAAGGPRMTDAALVGRPATTKKSALRVRREGVGTTTSLLVARSTVASPNHHDRRRPRSERRVRGLWSNENSDIHPSPVNHFAKLHDDTIGLIFSHLNVYDANESTQVCQRWRHVLTSREYRDRVRGVEATDYVRHVHEQQQLRELSSSSPSLSSSAPASVTTSRVVERKISQYRRAKSLVIRDIGPRLTSACYVPNLQRLTELTLTSYDDLSDLTLHAMLLSPTTNVGEHHVKRASGTTSLHVLRLEDCPLLTNEAVRSVALTCPHLHTLSLKGCRSVHSIVPLRALWKMTTTTPPLTTTKTSGTGRSAADRSGGSPLLHSSSGAKNLKGASEPLSLLSLFAASSSASSAAEETDASSARRLPTDLDSLFIAPPPSPTSVLRGPTSYDADRDMIGRRNPKDDKVASCLAGLFAPPCPRGDDVNNPHTLLAPNPHPIMSFVGPGPSRPTGGGALTDVDVSGTGVSPEAVLEALSLGGGVAAAPQVHLERLFATGPSQPWLPRHTSELAYLVDVALLNDTDVTISEPVPSYHEHRLPSDEKALSLIPSH